LKQKSVKNKTKKNLVNFFVTSRLTANFLEELKLCSNFERKEIFLDGMDSNLPGINVIYKYSAGVKKLERFKT